MDRVAVLSLETSKPAQTDCQHGWQQCSIWCRAWPMLQCSFFVLLCACSTATMLAFFAHPAPFVDLGVAHDSKLKHFMWLQPAGAT